MVGDVSFEVWFCGGFIEFNFMYFDYFGDFFVLVDMLGGVGFVVDGLNVLMVVDIVVVVIDFVFECVMLVELMLWWFDEWGVLYVFFVNKIENVCFGVIEVLFDELWLMSCELLVFC